MNLTQLPTLIKSQNNYDCAIAQLVLKNGSLSKAVYGKVCLPFSWFTKEVSNGKA